MQTARNIAHLFGSEHQGQVMGIYRPGQFPGAAITEPVTGVLQNLFLETYINTVAVGPDGWSGISGDLLISPDGDSDWTPILRFDLPSASRVRRLNLLFLAWENTPAVIAPGAYLGIQLVDVGNGFLPPGAFCKLWGSALEFSETAGELVIGGGTGGGAGGGGAGSTMTATQVRELLESLSGSERLDSSAVEGLPVAGGDFGSIQWQENGALKGSGQLTFNQVGLSAPGVFATSGEISNYFSGHGTLSTTPGGAPSIQVLLNDTLTNFAMRVPVPGNNAAAWVSADLGFVRWVDGIRIGSSELLEGIANSQAFLNSALIQVSSHDGVPSAANDWQTVGSISGYSGTTPQLLTFSFAPIQARHIRLFNPAAQAAFTLSEFRIRISSPSSNFALLSAFRSAFWITDGTANPVAMRPGEVRATHLRADTSLWVGGEPILAARMTGWTAGTGTPNFGTFNAASATAAQCAARILALEAAFRHHGLTN